VPPGEVQGQFRRWFERWGLPEQVRLDNGWPWGGWFDLPTAFALWLMGLGLKAHFNPPSTPQDNGVIERFNGLGQVWGELGKCQTVAEAQGRLDFADEVQREHMPSVGGKSRLQAHEGVRHSGRPYSREWEEENWSLQKAEEALETYLASRKVGSQGRISLCYRQVYVGKALHGSEVQVQYDRGSKMWVISRAGGTTVRTVPAIEISREKIMTLATCEEAKAKKRGVRGEK
jgi:hypothetical protein